MSALTVAVLLTTTAATRDHDLCALVRESDVDGGGENFKPLIRPVEAHPVETDDGMAFTVYDPRGLAVASVTVSEPALFMLSLFDGTHTLPEIGEAFRVRFGQAVAIEMLAGMVKGLDDAMLLDGPSFERHYAGLVDAYRAAPTRVMRSAEQLGLLHNTHETLQSILDATPVAIADRGVVVGVIAPHLDYLRGGPCYGAAYAQLINQPVPRRVIILGTNHFGLAASVVATGQDFETPLGVTRTDRSFIGRLEDRCGDLRAHEFDHDREHSVELQLLFCQHLWGADAFEMVPVLCPDPCGPTGTAPANREGVDLRDFAVALRETLDEDGGGGLIIAGADLSHIGGQFGDDRALDDVFAQEVRQRDAQALDGVANNDPDAFLSSVAAQGNPTRVCSAGCIFTLLATWHDATASVLHYHQALDPAQDVGVTCASVVLSTVLST